MDSKEILKAIDPKAAKIKELEEQVTKLTAEINELKGKINGPNTREKSKRRSNEDT
jgi:peptidoglycan hydrolase CwlO-like protein